MEDSHEFTEYLKELCKRTKKETGYWPAEFYVQVCTRGGVTTAKDLLAKPAPSEGLGRLFELGRAHDLSLEATVLDSPWAHLFTETERAVARTWLGDAASRPN